MLTQRSRLPADVVNPNLSQSQFAVLLRAAMEARHIGPAELSRRTADISQGKGIHPGTISGRYRKLDYDKGPPEPAVRRLLEEALRVPKYYLEGVGVTLGPISASKVGALPTQTFDTAILDEAVATALSEFRLTEHHGAVPRARAEFWVTKIQDIAKAIIHDPEPQAQVRHHNDDRARS